MKKLSKLKGITILFHGRLQPPHKGHICLIKRALNKYLYSRIVISLDIRDKNERNPYSFNYRKRKLRLLLKDYLDRIEIIGHKSKVFTLEACMQEIWVNLYKNRIKIDRVISGPDFHTYCQKFWNDRGIIVEKSNKRFYNLSSTKIRETLDFS